MRGSSLIAKPLLPEVGQEARNEGLGARKVKSTSSPGRRPPTSTVTWRWVFHIIEGASSRRCRLVIAGVNLDKSMRGLVRCCR